MANQVRIIVQPEVPGGYRPDTFDHLLQSRIHLAGLDRHWVHTLIAYHVADDHNSAELTIHSEPIQARSLTHGLTIDNGTPAARIRAVTPEGEVLTEVHAPAPLRAGQQVRVGADLYAVASISWPGRDPKTGVCAGDVDWQHAVLIPATNPGSDPVAVTT